MHIIVLDMKGDQTKDTGQLGPYQTRPLTNSAPTNTAPYQLGP